MANVARAAYVLASLMIVPASTLPAPVACLTAINSLSCMAAPQDPSACGLCAAEQMPKLKAAGCTGEVIGGFCAIQEGCSSGLNVSAVDVSLAGKTILITGSDGREGYPLTVAAVRAGAKAVIACSYNDATANTNLQRLQADLGPQLSSAVHVYGFDLSSFSQVRAFATKVLSAHPAIDTIIHVAGTMHMNPPGGNVTSDGFRVDPLVNVLSPALLNELLRPALMQAGKTAVPRVVSVTSASGYDHIEWPSADKAATAMAWLRGSAAPVATNGYYSLTKFLETQYSAELASEKLGSFSVAPGFFRDDPANPRYKPMCEMQVLWKPCPQWPEQGAASTLWTAAEPGLETHWNGALIDFHTTVGGAREWVQDGVSCVPRPLPPGWSDQDRAAFYEEVQTVVKNELRSH